MIRIVSCLVVLSLCHGSTHAASTRDFAEACRSSSNLGEAICECMTENARRRLSPKAFDFLVASMNKREAETARLRAELSFGELMATATFMANGPSECGGDPTGHAP